MRVLVGCNGICKVSGLYAYFAVIPSMAVIRTYTICFTFFKEVSFHLVAYGVRNFILIPHPSFMNYTLDFILPTGRVDLPIFFLELPDSCSGFSPLIPTIHLVCPYRSTAPFSKFQESWDSLPRAEKRCGLLRWENHCTSVQTESTNSILHSGTSLVSVLLSISIFL